MDRQDIEAFDSELRNLETRATEEARAASSSRFAARWEEVAMSLRNARSDLRSLRKREDIQDYKVIA